MKDSIKKGMSFGITSGIITTLGVMIGLNSITGLKLAVMGGILTVAIADAFSDALGIHNSEESLKRNTRKSIWIATVSTFFSKLIIAMSFLIPVLLFPLATAIKINLIWGFSLLGIFGYIVAKIRKENPIKSIFTHIIIAMAVIIITHYTGTIIGDYFLKIG